MAHGQLVCSKFVWKKKEVLEEENEKGASTARHIKSFIIDIFTAERDQMIKDTPSVKVT